MHPMLNVAVKAARRAGTVINRASLNLERLQVDRKQHNDFVTEVDKAAEAAIIETLSEPIQPMDFWLKKRVSKISMLRTSGSSIHWMAQLTLSMAFRNTQFLLH